MIQVVFSAKSSVSFWFINASWLIFCCEDALTVVVQLLKSFKEFSQVIAEDGINDLLRCARGKK